MMDKLQSDTPMTCTECGHVGKLFLPPDQAKEFKKQLLDAWWITVGWKWSVAWAVIGFCAGWWLK
jgi:hypothetical protein